MDSMVSICNSCKRRKFQGAEDALRSSCSGYDGSKFRRHGHTSLPAYREHLTIESSHLRGTG